jgi:DNA-binding LytR/AlgR family response regulator
MIKTVIIEDERLIADEFKRMLLNVSRDTEILGSFATVKESVDYLSVNEAPDLIFSDVQLPDGLSFDIFHQVEVKSPVVFVTAYDNFILNAFENNGIDYLLKPVDERDLKKTLLKYNTLKNHFGNSQSFVRSLFKKHKTRLLVKKGIENISIRIDDIVIIYTENKLVYIVDKDGKKFIADKHLGELEQDLDPNTFFRVNRQYIINIGFVKSYKAYEKVKLQIDLTMPDLHHQIIVSQEMAPCFRKWISEL